MLTGKGLCDGLITRPEESYRLWCVVVCDLENLKERGGHSPRMGCKCHKKKWVLYTDCYPAVSKARDNGM